MIGLGILVVGVVRLSQTTEEIARDPQAAAPTENLVPPATDSSGAAVDDGGSSSVGSDSEKATPEPGTLDVPG
jgi:hypothetical protein